jgi:gliding motility-associated-like protein
MWQSSTNGGASWTSIANSSTTQTFTNLTQTTIYQAIIGTPGCSTVTAVPDTVVYFANSNAGTINGATTVCEFLNFGTVNLTGYTGTSFQWQSSTDGGATWNNVVGAGASTSYSNISMPTAFQCIVTNGFCTPVTSNSVTINTQPGPTVSILTNDTSINPNSSLSIIATSSATSYTWTPSASVSNSSVLNPIVTPTITTTYTLLVESSNGCLNMDTIRVTVRPSEFQGVIANIITPNGDNVNDNWYIENIQAYKDVELKVFNEYGQLIYQSTDYKNDWGGTYNGTRLPDGTYYYVIEFKEFEQIVKGFITILSQ